MVLPGEQVILMFLRNLLSGKNRKLSELKEKIMEQKI